MLAEGAQAIQWKKAIMEVYFQRAAFYEELSILAWKTNV